MSDTDLAERVNDLEERVAYLERELDLSVDKERFERRVAHLPSVEDYEVYENEGVGYKAEVVVPTGSMPNVVNRIRDEDDIGWRVVGANDERMTLMIEEGLIHA